MSETCAISYHNVMETLHGICIYSNIFYLFAGLYALITFSGYKRFMGIFILLIGIVSVIHHSKEKAGVSIKFWTILDVALANIGAIIAILILIYLIVVNRVHRPSGVLTIIVGGFSILMFIFSEIESRRAESSGNPDDPIHSWAGPIFTEKQSPSPKPNYKAMSQEAMFLVYHTIWHLTSGITAMMWVLTMNSHPSSKKKHSKKR